jgi:hypothetical protein
VRPQAGERLAPPAQRPLVGAREAADDVEQGRLAGAVGSDDPQDLALLDVQADGVEGRQAAEADRGAVDLEATTTPAALVDLASGARACCDAGRGGAARLLLHVSSDRLYGAVCRA